MRKRMNQQLILTSVFATTVTVVLMVAAFWQLLQKQVIEDLKSYTELLRQADLYQSTELYQRAEAEDKVRVTWIGADGTILGDTGAVQENMGNHAERPEFKQALETGEGYDVRTSETLDINTYYYAVLMEDGTVLRVARDTRSAWAIVLSVIPGLVLALGIMLLFCIFMARVFAKNFVRPLEKLAETLDRAEGVTGYKELEPFVKTIRAQHENILRTARVRQDFTANVSHELKTPLTAISGYAELMEAGMIEGDEVVRYAKEIHHNSQRLLSLINDIIHLSEMDRTEYEVSMQQVNLSALAKECVDNLKISAENRSVSLRYVGEPAQVYGNKELLEELLWNLCDNAIRYNKEDGIVKVQVEKDHGEVRLSVSDTGIGIPLEHQERIFERFYRVDKSRSKETGGTGLGLAIVKHIVAQHGAELELNSTVGEGTKITVIFPVHQG